MTAPTATAEAIAKLAAKTTKSIMAAWMGGASMREGIQIFNNAGISSFPTPEQAIRAFMTLSDYSKNLKMLYETPKEVPVSFQYDRNELTKKIFERISFQKQKF